MSCVSALAFVNKVRGNLALLFFYVSFVVGSYAKTETHNELWPNTHTHKVCLIKMIKNEALREKCFNIFSN